MAIGNGGNPPPGGLDDLGRNDPADPGDDATPRPPAGGEATAQGNSIGPGSVIPPMSTVGHADDGPGNNPIDVGEHGWGAPTAAAAAAAPDQGNDWPIGLEDHPRAAMAFAGGHTAVEPALIGAIEFEPVSFGSDRDWARWETLGYDDWEPRTLDVMLAWHLT